MMMRAYTSTRSSTHTYTGDDGAEGRHHRRRHHRGAGRRTSSVLARAGRAPRVSWVLQSVDRVRAAVYAYRPRAAAGHRDTDAAPAGRASSPMIAATRRRLRTVSSHVVADGARASAEVCHSDELVLWATTGQFFASDYPVSRVLHAVKDYLVGRSRHLNFGRVLSHQQNHRPSRRSLQSRPRCAR
jgi:hypothetical protein